MSGAIFHKNSFTCERSMDLPGRCEFLMLRDISRITFTNSNDCIKKKKPLWIKKLSTHCYCTKFQIAMYSKDLCWCGFSNRLIARLLDMHKSAVGWFLRKFLVTGDVQCFKVGRPNISSLHVHEQFVLVEAALKDPSMTLEELLWKSKHSTGSQCSLLSRSVIPVVE